MSTLAHPVGVPAGPSPAELSVTWTVTETYTSRLPTGPVAALGRSVAELTANPAQLRGAIPDSLADWLAAEYQDDDHVVGEPQVEITTATSPDATALPDLINAARAAVRAEADTGPLSDTGQALTALLAGLVREEVIGQ